jgi:hypothetical protein
VCRQPPPGEEWGALLIYQIPSLWYQRTEYVVIKIGGELGGASGAIEYRHVVLNPLAGPGTYSEFDELAGSAGVGANLPKVGGIDVGAEASHDGRGFSLSPSVDVNLAGGEVNLQPNQAMAGYVNPVTGTGMRGGFQWEYARQVWALTTKYSVDVSGGASWFGTNYIDPNAELRAEHYEPPHGNMSGFDYLWLILQANNIPAEEHK